MPDDESKLGVEQWVVEEYIDNHGRMWGWYIVNITGGLHEIRAMTILRDDVDQIVADHNEAASLRQQTERLDYELTASVRGKSLLDALLEERQAWFDEEASLRQRLEVTEKALERYGKHTVPCLWQNNLKPCNCGFEAALKSTEKEVTPDA